MNKTISGNFHTHTYRCGHAEGDVGAYADEAVRKGLSTLGLSDHTPLPDNWMGSVRMDPSELEGYIRAVEGANREDLLVVKGMECDINPRYFGYYTEELFGRWGCRYLIGALHWYRHDGEWIYAGLIPSPAHLRSYTSLLIEGMQSGLFAFIAHPDHFAAGLRKWDPETAACSRAIIEAARDTGTLLEINGNGFRKEPLRDDAGRRAPYPWRPFWELVREYDIPVVCNSDAHRPADVDASLDLCSDLASGLGLRVGTVPLRGE